MRCMTAAGETPVKRVKSEPPGEFCVIIAIFRVKFHTSAMAQRLGILFLILAAIRRLWIYAVPPAPPGTGLDSHGCHTVLNKA